MDGCSRKVEMVREMSKHIWLSERSQGVLYDGKSTHLQVLTRWVVASSCHVHAFSPHWLNMKGSLCSKFLGEVCRFFFHLFVWLLQQLPTIGINQFLARSGKPLEGGTRRTLCALLPACRRLIMSKKALRPDIFVI